MPLFRDIGYYPHNIIIKTYIEHTIGLIKHKRFYFVESDIALVKVGYQLAWCCNNYIDAIPEGCLLLVPVAAVASTIYGNGINTEGVSQSLHMLIYLYRQFACRYQDECMCIFRSFLHY